MANSSGLFQVVKKPQGSVGARSIAAVLWGTGGAALRLILQVGAQIALARMLGPTEYGIFAIGATVIGFSAFFSEIGLAYGLIQKTTVGPLDVRFVFTWQVVLGIAVTAVIFGGSYELASFFGEPRSVSVIQALSMLCLLNALSAPAMNLLKRDLNFKTLQIIQLVSYAVGYLLVAIPLALAGAQVWSLVAAWLVQALISAGMLYAATRHPLKPLFWYVDARRQSNYGGAVFLTNLVNWAIGNIDRIIIARAFGSRDIGLYATTYNLLYNPTATLLGIVQQVFFSASSRIADEQSRILQGYKALVAAMALLILPVFAVVAAVPQTFIEALYGAKWHDAAALCRPLALVMPMFLLFGLTTPLLWTSGRAAKEFQIQLPVALLWLAVCALAATLSAVVVAWAVLALYSLRCAVVVGVATRSMGLLGADFWRCARGGLMVSVAMAASLVLADHLLQGLAAWQRLGLHMLLGTAVWLCLLRLLPALVAPELSVLFDRILILMPRHWARALAFLAPKGERQ